MPQLDPEQRKIVRLIRAEGQKIRSPRLRRIYERAAVQTGLVESNLRNLNYGDADSQGWRQERASLYPNPTNLRASIKRFREEFEQHYDPGERSYEVAAQVQRPAAQYRGRYQERAGEAARILRQVDGRGGSGLGDADRPDRYRTVPGVDNSGARQQLMQQYLLERGKPNALLQLKAGLDEAQDVPESRVRIRGPRQNSPNARAGGGVQVGGELRELFWNGPGALNVKNGQRVGKGFVSGHTDHVHVAGRPGAMDKLGRLAQRMGLHVSENETFDPVDPVHTQGSYHYRDMAVDVSGDPKLMKQFARRVARLYGV